MVTPRVISALCNYIGVLLQSWLFERTDFVHRFIPRFRVFSMSYIYIYIYIYIYSVSPSNEPILMSQSLTCGDGSSQTVAINWLVRCTMRDGFSTGHSGTRVSQYMMLG